jgi:RHH-type proline utilization regulon transcriptional repressor/proline dehydrogenase/delta 1-pyrroline-5-carboxylate dehydrogenase
LQFGHFEDVADVTVQNEIPNMDWYAQCLEQVEPEKLAWLHQAIRSDAYWESNLFVSSEKMDAGDLEVEGNYHRYIADDKNITIRVSQNAAKAELARLVVAAFLHRATISVDPAFQSSHGLSDQQLQHLVGRDFGRFAVETEQEFVDFMSTISAGHKLILVGSKEPAIDPLQANPDLFVIDAPITKSGRSTLLALYREQSISITHHRFGAIQSELVNIFEE